MGSSNVDTPGIPVHYHGGPVQVHPKFFVSYWGFNRRGSDPNGEQFYLTNFLAGIGGSRWLSDVTQYYEVVSGFRHFVHNGVGEMQGAWVDTTSIPSFPTDAQIQSAAKRLIAHFGFNKDATYFVATSHNHNTLGFGTQFCAYHNFLTVGGRQAVYVNMPYMSDAGATCGEHAVNPGPSGVLDGVSIIGAVIVGDAQTDPFPPSGWITDDGRQVGSDCSGTNLRDITFSTGTFAIEGLWSNKRDVCSDSGP